MWGELLISPLKGGLPLIVLGGASCCYFLKANSRTMDCIRELNGVHG